jgi:hypothetical protein
LKNTVFLPLTKDLLAIGIDLDRADRAVSKQQIGQYPSAAARKKVDSSEGAQFRGSPAFLSFIGFHPKN